MADDSNMTRAADIIERVYMHAGTKEAAAQALADAGLIVTPEHDAKVLQDALDSRPAGVHLVDWLSQLIEGGDGA